MSLSRRTPVIAALAAVLTAVSGLPAVAAAPTRLLAIDVGGPGDVDFAEDTDAAPHDFLTEPGDAIVGPISVTSAKPTVQDTPLSVFETQRTGDAVIYAIPVSDATYTVWLDFAELEASRNGERKVDIYVEGRRRLDDLDLYAKGRNRAQTLRYSTAVTDGVLDVEVRTGRSGSAPAVLNGLEIWSDGGSVIGAPSPTPTDSVTPTETSSPSETPTEDPTDPPTTPPGGGGGGTEIFINTGGPTVSPFQPDELTAPHSLLTSPDAAGFGPTPVSALHGSVVGTPNEVFTTARSGEEISYAIPVTNGTYEVRFDLAEIDPSVTRNGRRYIDLMVEGATRINDLDIHAKARKKGLTMKFSVDVSDGVLNVAAVQGRRASLPAILNGLEVRTSCDQQSDHRCVVTERGTHERCQRKHPRRVRVCSRSQKGSSEVEVADGDGITEIFERGDSRDRKGNCH